ncbi:leucine-rich repeat-containing protein 45-like isoform X2 [Rhopalosiphum padi]|uniref:leucine-rich repeat-containing protein 45-like isoform X2 n=1 Tax=Rhopalosiphum padi TaxID=40932 RepID=UPI00298DB151|nr:leucine-rich repeat-containing protein 45-like isoform X2 [Rhopalosiphum padi]
MDIDICNIYQTLCLKNKIPSNEFIVSCLYNASVYGELNLKSTTITKHSCSLIAKTLKYASTINILNLSDCLLPVNGLKDILNSVNYLTNLKILNLKGNQIGNTLTTYISKILLNNNNITELRLDWNNIGDSVDTFSQLCHSLKSNTVLNILILANNNLCQTCGYHLAKMLNINKSLKNIDLSWNCVGETGAELLMKSLKNNEILLELNIQGNSVSMEMSSMIAEQLKQNKSNEINQKEVQVRNLSLLEHVASVDKNYQTQLNILNNQYHNRVDELQSNLQLLQLKNQEQKQELEELKKKSLKDQENYILISNQIKKIKSEASFNKQSLNSLITKISNEIPNSDMEYMNLEDLDKIFYIISKIKKNCDIKVLQEKKECQRLIEVLPKLTNELKTLKGEWENFKSSTELNIKDYSDELIAIKKLLLTNMYHRKISNKISNEINMNNLIRQQEEIKIYDKQTNVLLLLNTKIKTLHKEKSDLEIKLAEAEIKSVEANETMKVLQKNLILAKDELIKLNKTELYNIAAQTTSDTLAKEIDILKTNFAEKDNQLRLSKIEIDKININHETELINLEKKFQSEFQAFKEKRHP